MKYFYYTVEDIHDSDGTRVARKKMEPGDTMISSVLRVDGSINLCHKLAGFLYATPRATKKEALALANEWNRQHFDNGVYPFNKIYPAIVIE